MIKYIIKRLLITILILFGVSVILYTLVRFMPDDFVDIKFSSQLLQGTITQEQIDAMKALYGINDSSFMGIIKGYFNWLGQLLRGNLGMSFLYNAPVQKVIASKMWISFGISAIALVLQFLIAIPLGIKAAVNQYGVMDYTVTILVMMGISLPSFFLGNLLIKFFAVDIPIFPIGGLVDPTRVFNNGFERFLNMLWHMILPMLVMVILSIGSLMRYTRTNTLEVLNADYIRTARAKGCSERSVIYKHAFRNTLIPVVTMLAGILPGLFGGAMITEEVFAIDGIGRIAYKATSNGDINFIMGYNMFLAVLTVIGTFLSDLMYAVVDPRVKITR